MDGAMPRMTVRETGEAISIARYVSDWGHGGEMRGFMGDQPKEPSSPLERGAMLAYDVAATGMPGFGTPSGTMEADRRDLSDLLAAGLRIAVVDERVNDGDGRSDVDRARLVLTSMAVVAAMRDRSYGMEPEPLLNPVLEAARAKSGVEASAFSPNEAGAVGVGMPDMVTGAEASRQIAAALRGAMEPFRDDAMEDRLRMADATWPAVRPREGLAEGASPRGPEDRSRDEGPAAFPADRSGRGR